ncbi:Rhomboid family protein [hydrothermal vent metagenome]|uniref:Rhomboid family protein n=1 Tax=hydrothermal vent metagenome TaxID=652676 RepID=A0A3B1CZS6_9ZZZZ
MKRLAINKRIDNFKFVLYFLGVCWVAHVVNFFVPIQQYGIHPRSVPGLLGILFSPFLHGSFSHLISNSFGLLVFGWALGVVDRKNFIEITFGVIIMGGLGTWVFGRTANHIGASGLIFGYFGYLLSLGFFQKKFKYIIVSLLTIFFYGGMIFGILPSSRYISFEGHLFGFMAGVLIAKLR